MSYNLYQPFCKKSIFSKNHLIVQEKKFLLKMLSPILFLLMFFCNFVLAMEKEDERNNRSFAALVKDSPQLKINEEKYFKTFDELEWDIRHHHAIKHPLFTYLKNCSQEGFTAKQFQIYRDNYFFRTLHTIPSVAFLVVGAALNGDMETLATAGKNLFEELGCGDAKGIHSNLMLSCHNRHGLNIFNLKPIEFKDIQNSPFILDEARSFVENEKALYTNVNYSIILGAGLAHETAADPMLTNFLSSFFKGYKEYYGNEEFESLTEYFSIHLNDGLEQDHAKNAALAARRWAKDQKTLNDIAQGSLCFLDIQAQLWDALFKKLKEAECKGKKIPFVPPVNKDLF